MESNKTRISTNLTEKNKMDMDREYVKKIQRSITRRVLQWNQQGQRRTARPKNTWETGVEQEMKEAHYMGHSGDNSSRPRAMEAARWWPHWPMLHYRSNKGISHVSQVSK